MNLEPLVLSFKLAFFVTLILFFIGLPYSYFLANTKSKFKPFLETISALPIVLPPSVLGFYLLIFFSNLPFNLLFTFKGILIASIIYSFPFMVQPLQSGFESIPKNLIEASYVSGKGKITTLFKVVLPNMKASILTALIITFAHTLGEFGVVLMVGGAIPGKTEVASVAIYDLVEIMDYKNAHIYSAILLIISFLVLFLVYLFNHSQKRNYDLY
jgi:molybdate transport system permease protein